MKPLAVRALLLALLAVPLALLAVMLAPGLVHAHHLDPPEHEPPCLVQRGALAETFTYKYPEELIRLEFLDDQTVRIAPLLSTVIGVEVVWGDPADPTMRLYGERSPEAGNESVASGALADAEHRYDDSTVVPVTVNVYFDIVGADVAPGAEGFGDQFSVGGCGDQWWAWTTGCRLALVSYQVSAPDPTSCAEPEVPLASTPPIPELTLEDIQPRPPTSVVETVGCAQQPIEGAWVASLAVDTLPVVGTVKSVWELFNGRDYITNECLGNEQRGIIALALLASVFGLGGLLKLLLKRFPMLSRLVARLLPKAQSAANRLGIDDVSMRHLQRFADKYGIEVDLRKVNPHARLQLEAGALPKPPWLKSKSIDEFDVMLGAPPNGLGKVGFFPPTLPRNFAELPIDQQSKLLARQGERLEDFASNHHYYTELEEARFIKVDGGVVHDARTGKAFAATTTSSTCAPCRAPRWRRLCAAD